MLRLEKSSSLKVRFAKEYKVFHRGGWEKIGDILTQMDIMVIMSCVIVTIIRKKLRLWVY